MWPWEAYPSHVESVLVQDGGLTRKKMVRTLSHMMAALFGTYSEEWYPLFSHYEDSEYDFSFLTARFHQILKGYEFVQEAARLAASGTSSDVLPRMALFCADALKRGMATWFYLYILNNRPDAAPNKHLSSTIREAARQDWMRMNDVERDLLLAYFPDIHASLRGCCSRRT